MGENNFSPYFVSKLLGILLLLLGQHRQGQLVGVTSSHLVRYVLLGLLDGVEERLVHGGALDLSLQVGIRLLEVSLEHVHAVQKLLQTGCHCYLSRGPSFYLL